MQPSRVYRQVPNFNIIPPEYQKPIIPRRRLWLRLLLVIVIVAEVLFSLNLYRDKSTLEEAAASARQKIQEVDKKLAAVNTQKEEAEGIQATIEKLRQERQAIDDWKELVTNQADWSRVMAALFLSRPQGVVLSSVNLAGSRIDASGTALDHAQLFEYYSILLDSPVISQIISLSSVQGESSIVFSLIATIKVEEK